MANSLYGLCLQGIMVVGYLIYSKYNYHDSLQGCLIEGLGRSTFRKLFVYDRSLIHRMRMISLDLVLSSLLHLVVSDREEAHINGMVSGYFFCHLLF